MKAGAPWSIKGIDPEAREAAKIAAAQVGMTLGEFFNHLLLDSNPAGIVGGEAEPVPGSKRMSASSAEPEMAHTAPAGAVHDLAERMQETETQTAKDMSDIRQSITDISGQITSLSEQTDQQGASGEISPSALEDINHRISETQQQSEAAVTETQNTLSEISERIETSISSNNKAVATLGKAIEVMAGRLDGLEHKTEPGEVSAAITPPIDESMEFGARHEPETDPFAPPAKDFVEEIEEDVSPDIDELLTSDPATDIAEDADAHAPDSDLEAEDSTADIFENEIEEDLEFTTDEQNSSFDVDADLSNQPDETESELQETDNSPATTEFSSETVSEDLDAEPSDPNSGTSVDDFLNQFGEEEPLIPETVDQEDQEEDGAVLDTDPALEMKPLSELPEFEVEEPDTEEPVGKSAQDVIEAIRRAARGPLDENELGDDDEQLSSDDEIDTGRIAVVGDQANNDAGSSRVKYAIYAACSAILLAASGLIASVKGLI